MKKLGIKFWLFGVILIILVIGSLAYVLTGQQWPVGSVVAYYINANTPQVTNEADAVKNAANSR